jgi:hypothetical protein
MISKNAGQTSIKDLATGDSVTVGTKSGGEKGLHAIASIDSIGGTTWPVITRTDVSSQVVTATGQSPVFNADGMGCISFGAQVSNVTGTNPKILIELESSDDQVNWNRVHSLRRFDTADFQRVVSIRLASRYYRYSYIVSGTAPSFTVTISVTLKPYLPQRTVALSNFSDLNIGSVNNVSTSFNAAGLSNVFVQANRPVDGGNQSQFIVQASIDDENWIDISGNIALTSGSSALATFTGVAYRFYRLLVKSAASTATLVDVFWGGNS